LRQEIDLRQHLLFVAFKNKFIEPSSPESTQELISRLMVEYPNSFPSSVKISYTIAALKNEGLVEEDRQLLDQKEYERCIESMKQQHPRMSEQRIRKECLKRVGYRSIILPTEAGIIEFCSRVKPYLTDRSTRTNSRILDVCETYKTEGEQL
jgi:hypothetical protein